MPKRTPNPFEAVTRNLNALTLGELEELVDVLQALIDARYAEDDFEDEKGETYETRNGSTVEVNGKRGGRGHIEAKMINGYGPYLYLRYWHGGKLRSKYLGKAEQEGSES